MPEELEEQPRGIGRHGRLSPDYAQASLDSQVANPRADQADSPPRAAAGRLRADYLHSVAEMMNNPAAFFRVVLDERFDGQAPGWPNDAASGARLVPVGYRLTPRVDNPFVAIGAPVGTALGDVLVGGTFRKVGGPSGGIYGLLLRDREPGPRDGRHQAGHYYIAQVDDRGAVGIWRREQDNWVELAPWSRCAAVRPPPATNDLSFEVVGGRLTFVVNGSQAASAHDAVLASGGVGLFAGGSDNDVLVERFVVHALS